MDGKNTHDEIRTLTAELHAATRELDALLETQAARSRLNADTLAFKKIMAHAGWLTARIEARLPRHPYLQHPATRERAGRCLTQAREWLRSSCDLLYGRFAVSLLDGACRAGRAASELPLHDRWMEALRSSLTRLPLAAPRKDAAPGPLNPMDVALSRRAALRRAAGAKARRGRAPGKPKKRFSLFGWLTPPPNVALGERALRRYTR